MPGESSSFGMEGEEEEEGEGEGKRPPPPPPPASAHHLTPPPSPYHHLSSLPTPSPHPSLPPRSSSRHNGGASPISWPSGMDYMEDEESMPARGGSSLNCREEGGGKSLAAEFVLEDIPRSIQNTSFALDHDRRWVICEFCFLLFTDSCLCTAVRMEERDISSPTSSCMNLSFL